MLLCDSIPVRGNTFVFAPKYQEMIQLSLQTAKYCPAIVCLCDYARLAAIVHPFSSVLRNNNELLVVLYLHALSLIRRKLKNMHKNNNKQTTTSHHLFFS